MSLMNKRVCHASRNLSMRYKQLVQIMEREGTFVWVVEGETFRDASASEIARARAAFARKNPGPLPMHELPTFKFVLPQQPGAVREEKRLAYYPTRTVRAVRGEFCWLNPAAKYAESCA